VFGDSIHYTDKREIFEAEVLNDFLKEKNHNNIFIEKISPSIEDCFIDLMIN
jgi:hypothetical protein